MNVIYNSDNYYVVEYPAQLGYELIDKQTARGGFIQGEAAKVFAQSMKDAVEEDASSEHVDEFLGNFDVLLNVPIVYH